MSVNQKTISYLLIIISVFLLLFVITDQYNKMQEKLDNRASLVNQLKTKQKDFLALNSLKKSLSKNKGVIEKYTKNFTEDEMIKYIYDYTIDPSKGKIVIKNMDFSKWVKNELWFIESDINLSIRVENEQAMLNFIDFLTKKDSTYTFFINNFSYPYDNREGSFDVNIPLKLFYTN